MPPLLPPKHCAATQTCISAALRSVGFLAEAGWLAGGADCQRSGAHEKLDAILPTCEPPAMPRNTAHSSVAKRVGQLAIDVASIRVARATLGRSIDAATEFEMGILPIIHQDVLHRPPTLVASRVPTVTHVAVCELQAALHPCITQQRGDTNVCCNGSSSHANDQPTRPQHSVKV